MRRRDFITLVGGAAAGWPLAARAQQSDQMRRIGVLMSFAAADTTAQARLGEFLQTLQQLGWTDGRNVRVDIRWSASEPERIRRYAAELVAFMPDVILASTTPGVAALQQASHTVPIVFVQVAIPSELAWLRVWRSRAVTPPALLFTNTAWLRNGWNC
jgi:putative ABC transport system substrate-binding protein